MGLALWDLGDRFLCSLPPLGDSGPVVGERAPTTQHFGHILVVDAPSRCFTPLLPAIMALRIQRSLALAAFSLSCFASAYSNFSSVDMMRAQIALMDDRPKDCPPWYD